MRDAVIRGGFLRALAHGFTKLSSHDLCTARAVHTEGRLVRGSKTAIKSGHPAGDRSILRNLKKATAPQRLSEWLCSCLPSIAWLVDSQNVGNRKQDINTGSDHADPALLCNHKQLTVTTSHRGVGSPIMGSHLEETRRQHQKNNTCMEWQGIQFGVR